MILIFVCIFEGINICVGIVCILGEFDYFFVYILIILVEEVGSDEM